MSIPGGKWRILAEGRGGKRVELDSKNAPSVFDECVVDDWFHLEQMDDREWWMAITEKKNGKYGGRHVLWVTVKKNGDVTARHEFES